MEAAAVSPIFTVGHSDHTPEKLGSLLNEAGIEYLVDVRSNPSSGWAPQWSITHLPGFCKRYGLSYVWMGVELGGQPSDQELWRAGWPDFSAISQTEAFRSGIDRIITGQKQGHRLCLMCSEEDPARCHRHGLITTTLIDMGVEPVLHLRGDGIREDPAQTSKRMIPRQRRQWQQTLL